MFSLFQDHSLTKTSTNDAPLPIPERNPAGGSDHKIDLRLGQRPGTTSTKRQNSWCNEVLKLKKDLQDVPKKSAPAIPFQHFHSKRNLGQMDVTPTDPLSAKTLPLSYNSTESQHATPIVQAVPISDLETSNSEMSKARHVRFVDLPTVVDCQQNYDDSARCKPIVSKQVYWTRKEVNNMKKAALKSARAFRQERPAAVKRLKQLFEEICWKHSNCDDDSADTLDEEAEEVLHRFLVDWGLSTVRGLEERIVPRRVFDQDRRLALESVLAYQQLLRETGVHSPNEMEAMLSVRSESASRKARVFAMYMALGDALAVAAFQADEMYGSDEDSITFA